MGQRAKDKHILVVDDDDDLRRVVQLVYGGAYAIDEAATVAEARSRLATAPYDLLVLDIHLPDGNGTDLLQALRSEASLAGYRNLPVVMLTASADGKDYEKTWDLGSVAYVHKPFEVPQLSEAIETALAAAT